MRHPILVSAALNLMVGLSFLACSSSDDGVGTGGTGGAGGAGGSAGTGGAGGGGTGGAGGAGGTAGAGMSGAGGTAGCDKSFNYTSYTPGTAMRTLAADVYPIFQMHTCALNGACHGTGNITPRLGSTSGMPTMSTLMTVRTALLGNSVEATTVALVKPGEPQNSYLMHKLDGSQDCAGVMCAKHPGQPQTAGCGLLMPQGATEPIDIAQRNIVRDWIKQGAPL